LVARVSVLAQIKVFWHPRVPGLFQAQWPWHGALGQASGMDKNMRHNLRIDLLNPQPEINP